MKKILISFALVIFCIGAFAQEKKSQEQYVNPLERAASEKLHKCFDLNSAPLTHSENHSIAITAHRGYWNCGDAGFAENSIASLKAAQSIEVWGSEFDVQITRDSVMIVNHDNEREGLTISETAWSEFEKMKLKNGERPSTLGEYLTQGEKFSTVLVCELKPQKTTDLEILLTNMAVDTIKSHSLFSPDRVIFISFSYEICKHLVRVAPGFTVQYLGGKKSPDELFNDGINGLDYHHSWFSLHPEWVTRAHELGMSVNVWTVNKIEDIQKMIDLKVDCITTNYPLLVRNLLGNKEIRR